MRSAKTCLAALAAGDGALLAGCATPGGGEDGELRALWLPASQ